MCWGVGEWMVAGRGRVDVMWSEMGGTGWERGGTMGLVKGISGGRLGHNRRMGD